MSFCKFGLKLLGAICFLAFTLVAQTGNGIISGVVEDESGAVVPGANVTVTNVDTGISRSIVTDEAGRYRVPGLIPDNYEVEAQLTGFETTVRAGIKLTVGSEAVIDLVLRVGQVAQRTVVTAEAPLIETVSSTVSGLVDDRTIRNLPLNGRSFDQLIALESSAPIHRGKGRGGAGHGRQAFYTVAGARTQANLYLLDGTQMVGGQSSSSLPGGALGMNMGVDAVREFSVMTSNYSAAYGKQGGGIINMASRSGTNQLHGSAFEFLRNDNLDARNFFDRDPKNPLERSDPPEFKRNQFGGTLGGPIRQDQTFFFGNYEGLRERLGLTNVAIVPDDDARKGILAGKDVRNGDTEAEKAASFAVVEPFFSLWPRVNVPQTPALTADGRGEHRSSPTEESRQDFFMVRIDHRLSDQDTLFGRYNFSDARRVDPADIPSRIGLTDSRDQVATLNWTRATATIVNTARLGFTRGFTFQDSLLTLDTPLRFIEGANDIGQLLIGGSSGQESRQFSDGGTANSAERFNAPNQFEFSDEVFYSRGPHALQFGVTFHRMQHNFARPSRKRGAHEFTSLRNFIRVNPRRFRAGFGDPTKAMRRNYFATFIQDDFKATRNLTLNLGFRYEFMTTPTEASGDRISNFRHQFVDGLFVLRTEPFIGSPYWENNSYLSLAPRVGFAWDPFADAKMAVRGGFGIFYDQGVDEYRGFVNNVPFFDTVEIRRPTPFPFGFAGASGRSRSSPDAIDFDLKVPTRVTWNFGIERQITENTGFAIRYVGSQSYHLSRRSPGNTAIPERLPDGTLFYVRDADGDEPERRNPDLGGNRFVTTDSVSAYHSLQWDLSQRFSENLQYKISYTFSRNIDDASNPNSALVEGHPDMTQNPEDRAADRALSAYDVRNSLAANFSYTLPGANLTGASALLGGWQLGGIVSISSGIPITAQTSFNRALDQSRSTSDRPNLRAGFSNNPIEGVTAGCEGVAAGQKLGTPDLYYDPCAFELPPEGFYGNLGRSTIIGPGFANVDFSVTKMFPITENTRIDFRAEFFNLFNRANFDLPDAAMFDEDTEAPLSTAGQIRRTVAGTASRQIQFGLKFTF